MGSYKGQIQCRCCLTVLLLWRGQYKAANLKIAISHSQGHRTAPAADEADVRAAPWGSSPLFNKCWRVLLERCCVWNRLSARSSCPSCVAFRNTPWSYSWCGSTYIHEGGKKVIYLSVFLCVVLCLCTYVATFSACFCVASNSVVTA